MSQPSASRFVVGGTDTGIGKTVFAAALAGALRAAYWKPVQSGLDGEESDSDTVARLSGVSILPEAYRLTQPLSPHRAAEIDGKSIDQSHLALPETDEALIVEAAGGLLVPLTRERLFIDQMADWGLPVILVARTGLGTINHTLLSLDALDACGIECHGIAFVGEDNPDTIRTIGDFRGARVLGRLPRLARLTRETLSAAFADHFAMADFV